MVVILRFTLILTVISSSLCDDFYELLNVGKDASTREIRKAFKKLAIVLHPDKNKETGAHEKFLRLNRAYEVLKDENLRKKYDLHGEEGLKDDGRSSHYEGWDFYQNYFGIYDNDEEIITLSHSDFSQSVSDSEDVWFINFYSPDCSHCHELAPTWRDLAIELDGVIRIGAVNCADEGFLCNQEGIHAYPSLLIYPAHERYTGEKSAKRLVKHALKYSNSKVRDIWTGNLETISQDMSLPWLVTFCGDGGDCLEDLTLSKLAAMLHRLVNVGRVNCYVEESVCSKLDMEHGTVYYANGISKVKTLLLDSLETKEVAKTVLRQLPDMQLLTASDWTRIRQDDSPWLIIFTESESDDLELRKLPALLLSVNIGRIHCSSHADLCKEMHIHSYPTFAILKNRGEFELHYGRTNSHDVAHFVRENMDSRVRALNPADFPEPVIGSGQPWFVDFFSPLCPPCLHLLPIFRHVSKLVPNVNFGTVDCTVHRRLCNEKRIRSFPTTVFYNQSQPHVYHGHHQTGNIIQFIDDTLRPLVVKIDESNYNEMLGNKPAEQMWLVDFHSPSCGPCQQLAPEWNQLAKTFKDNQKVVVANFNCQAHRWICQQQGVRSYPTIRLYPIGARGDQSYYDFNGWFRDSESIYAWAHEFMPSKVRRLDVRDFYDTVFGGDDGKPWVVDFYAEWCGHCQVFAPEFERAAEVLSSSVNFGKVECDQNDRVCAECGVRAYPTIRFYPIGSKSALGEELDAYQAVELVEQLKSKLKRTTRDEL